MTVATSRPGLAREVQRLGEALHDARDRDLVDHLRELARARGPDQAHRLRERADHGLGRRERLGVAADHDRELAVLGAGLAARHRRVEAVHAALARRPPRSRARRRPTPSCDRQKMAPARIAAMTPPEPSAMSRRSGSSPTQLNTISAPCAAAAGVAAALPPYCVHQRSAFAAVRLYTVTLWPFSREPARHRKAHDAETQERYVRHRLSPVAKLHRAPPGTRVRDASSATRRSATRAQNHASSRTMRTRCADRASSAAAGTARRVLGEQLPPLASVEAVHAGHVREIEQRRSRAQHTRSRRARAHRRRARWPRRDRCDRTPSAHSVRRSGAPSLVSSSPHSLLRRARRTSRGQRREIIDAQCARREYTGSSTSSACSARNSRAIVVDASAGARKSRRPGRRPVVGQQHAALDVDRDDGRREAGRRGRAHRTRFGREVEQRHRARARASAARRAARPPNVTSQLRAMSAAAERRESARLDVRRDRARRARSAARTLGVVARASCRHCGCARQSRCQRTSPITTSTR